MPAQFVIDPTAYLDFAFDWSGWLVDSETVTAQTVACADGNVLVNSVTEAGGVVTWWASGGVLGQAAKVTNHITTSQGRQDDRSMTFMIRDR